MKSLWKGVLADGARFAASSNRMVGCSLSTCVFAVVIVAKSSLVGVKGLKKHIDDQVLGSFCSIGVSCSRDLVSVIYRSKDQYLHYTNDLSFTLNIRPMNKILVPIDFSPAATNALAYALRLAAPNHAEVVALHAYLPAVPEAYLITTIQQGLEDDIQQFAQEAFDRMCEKFEPELLKEVQLSFRLEMGSATDTIRRVAKEWQPDLVVMGMRSGSPLAKKIFGSTTSGVMQRLTSPMMVVPAEVSFRPILHILFASDLQNDDIELAHDLLKFAERWSGKLSCVHVLGEQDFEEDLQFQYLRNQLQEELPEVTMSVLSQGDVVDTILHHAELRKADLIVMRTHVRGFWGSWLNASHSKDLARKTPLPLLIYPMVEEA